MAWAHVISTAQALGNDGGTSTGIDTSGADTLFWVLALDLATAPTISDSKSNTWTLAHSVTDGFNRTVRLYRSAAGAASVGTGHTFTATLTAGVIGMAMGAFSGGATSSIDDQTNAGSGTFGSTISPGSITPTADNTVCITGVGVSDTGTDPNSINASFTIGAHVQGDNGGSHNFGCGIAYLIQTAAAAANPTWTFSASCTFQNAVIADFKSAAVAAAPTMGYIRRARLRPAPFRPGIAR